MVPKAATIPPEICHPLRNAAASGALAAVVLPEASPDDGPAMLRGNALAIGAAFAAH
ncbi:hypothetical protein RGQ15_13040 [Paracoccus sp. MBLB3053]|uniref:Uncharacterized protein n=1 Tax=Paracoccus aurantius TaxID=3073814 RepID=A0ABU2HTY2_9RHOB|nr:hypothetical protein [Paracoccus sp. MBLB3053]MDS9468493.1 hypothetical protein [Paracoccus sp. MBLB3053]